MDASGRQLGTVTWFEKGFKLGGIEPLNGGEEVLVNLDNVRSKSILRERSLVEYFVGRDDTGRLVALDVVVVSDGGKKAELPLFVDSGKTVGGSSLVAGGRVCGTVNLFNQECGQIKPTNGGDEVFVHQSNAADVILENGLCVEYLVSPRESGSGFEAVQVTLPSTVRESRFGFGIGGGMNEGESGMNEGKSGMTDNFGFWNGDEFVHVKGAGGNFCYACSRSGHTVPDCTAEEQHGGGGGGCYNCGMHDHYVRDCPTLGGLCPRCLQGNHLESDCPVTRRRGGRRGGAGGQKRKYW